MAREFDPTSQAVPTAVPWLRITLNVAKVRSDPEDPESPLKNDYSGEFRFDITDQDGSTMDTRSGNIVPHLTEAQKTAIIGFLDNMMTKAEGTLA